MVKIINALVTPLDADGKEDPESLSRLLDHCLASGTDGFFLFGNMGEGKFVSAESKYNLARAACEQIGNRADIILCVSADDEDGIYRNVKMFNGFSHDYLAGMLPNKDKITSSPVSLVHKIADLCERPFFFYYIPKANGVVLNPHELEQILSHPNVAGLKNSSDVISIRKELLFLKRSLDFELYEGCEWGVDEALFLGCDGFVLGLGSLGIRVFQKIIAAFECNQQELAKEYQFELLKIFHMIYGAGNVHSIIGQKYALHKLGILKEFKTLHPAQQFLEECAKREIENCLSEFQSILGFESN